MLCQIFAQILKRDSVSPSDNFFELGGHSLLATRMVSRIRRTLDIDVTVGAIFEAPTAARLAASLENVRKTRLPVRHFSRPDVVPLSFAQQRLWFLEQLEGPSSTYIVSLAGYFQEELKPDVLAAALRDVLRRHEVLRTIFAVTDGQPHQLVLDPDDPACDVLSVIPADSQQLRLRMSEAASHAFDLAAELPMRVALFRTTSEKDEHNDSGSVLVLVVHHIATDGWSMGLLWRDLSTAYEARAAGRAPDWTPLPVQYIDYTLWQRDLLGDFSDPDSLLNRQVTYWREALTDAPQELEFPTDRPRPAISSHESGIARIEVPSDVHVGLARIARERGVTMFMLLQAAVATLLFRLGSGEDIPIGTPIAGRTDEALHDLVGFFINTIVLRTDLSGDPSFIELLRRVRSRGLKAFDNQDVPFERLVEELAPERSMGRHPLFQVMLNVERFTRTETVGLAGAMGAPGSAGTPAAKFDLDFGFAEELEADGRPAGLAGNIVYARDLFDEPS
ncbi:condensation domain-containing protein, partial [Streptomyces fuscichromogenes]|uniref:condensation domain-containing protein n=1 Tax=Streptomyces fuscichromogenes TaxID=1324013 RepID=UPI0027E50A83